MKSIIGIGAFIFLSVTAFACTSNTTVEPGGGTSNSDGGPSANQNGDGSAAQDGAAASDGSNSSDGGAPVVVSSTPASITFGTCPAFNACGGDLSGTWDYNGGCVTDPFAAIKKQCPTATESNVSGTIIGTVNVLGNAIFRSGTANYTGTVTLPAECTMGASCATVQQALAGAADSITCTGTSSCDCVITGHSTVDESTTFTQNGNSITTASGSTYDVCVNGSTLTENETDANAAEPGAFTLAKR